MPGPAPHTSSAYGVEGRGAARAFALFGAIYYFSCAPHHPNYLGRFGAYLHLASTGGGGVHLIWTTIPNVSPTGVDPPHYFNWFSTYLHFTPTRRGDPRLYQRNEISVSGWAELCI